MAATKYDPADHGKVRGTLHIDDVDISDDRSTARIMIAQRNQPGIRLVYYFGLTDGGTPYMLEEGKIGRLVEAFPEI